MDSVKVSVIIPSYNRFDTLMRAINSVNFQTFRNLEIIVVNDCSTDTRYYGNILETIKNVKVLHLPINQKIKYSISAAQGKTREEGIKISRGEWIAFLDDDDYWYPMKLQEQLDSLKNFGNCKMCSTNMYSNGNVYLKYNLPNILNFDIISEHNHICNSTVIIHRSIINKVGQFDIGKNEDWKYWLRALKYTDCLYIKTPLVYYETNQKKFYKYS
jgi:glycosyltransferase involved in cell wall biosynthesis